MSFISAPNSNLIGFSKKYNERFDDYRDPALYEWVYYEIKI